MDLPRRTAKTAPRIIVATQRRIEALALRKQGLSFEKIADKLGYGNRGNAYRAVVQELSALRHEAGDDLLKLELIRLDALLEAVWPAAMKDNNGAVERALRIIHQRARLLGLDKQGPEPTKTEVPSIQIRTIIAVLPQELPTVHTTVELSAMDFTALPEPMEEEYDEAID